MNQTFRTALLLSAALLSAACGGATRAPAAVTISAAALTPGQFYRVTIDATPADGQGTAQSVEMTVGADGQYYGTLSLAPGYYAITVNAYGPPGADGVAPLLGSGTAWVDVTGGPTTSVFVRILDTAGPPPVPDHAPVITDVQLSTAAPAAGAPVVLSATAVDPDGDAIAYAWTAACAGGTGGSFTDATAAVTAWTPDAAGDCTLSLQVTAKGLGDGWSAAVTVAAGASAGTGVVISSTFVAQPWIGQFDMYAPNGDLFCWLTRSSPDASCAARGTTGGVYRIDVGTDGQTPGDAVMLGDDCGGSAVEVATSGAWASFDWTAPAAPGLCMITPSVESSGLWDSLPVAVVIQ